ncbi:hypothetical protein OFS07_01840 [Brachyspira hyodysenteriae]|nr:hypothetical protein [Brachyspira hyodysenteriae]KLI59271.1 hypothetical protein SZ44_09015 [Brachyspira hyodysenteriae]MDA0065024.1 hypothetical protein [Brachyspira hyodysenteriae]QTM11518.1 hypothetical protein GQX59_08785 [Brachyspira hyodysenteriae]HJH55652.1 hypothetical protein [Brachyspira hyodysenteriae]
MIKTLDEAITFYKKKHKLLENYDIEKAEEYKQLADWLIDLKRLKEEEAQYNRWNMIYDNYTKNQIDKNINKKEIEALKEGLCQ